MRLVCARPHVLFDRDGVGPDETFETLGAFLFHLVAAHCFGLRARLVELGFIDSPHEFGLLFWRWDFWNSNIVRRDREYERQQWEHKRDRARARWGDGAG